MISWHLLHNGSDTNGGGFNMDASGTDYSMTSNPIAVLNDVSSPSLSSPDIYAGSISGVSAIDDSFIGNFLYLSGSEFNSSWYEIVAVIPPNGCTLDSAPSKINGASNGSANVGGSLNSLGGIGGIISSLATRNSIYYQYHHLIFMKNTDGHPFVFDSGISANHSGGPIFMDKFTCSIIGYGDNKWDNGRAIINVTGDGSYIFVTAVSETHPQYSHGCNIINLEIRSDGSIAKCFSGPINAFNCVVSGFVAGFDGCVAMSCKTSESTLGFAYCDAVNCIANNTHDGFNICNVIRCYVDEPTSNGLELEGGNIAVGYSTFIPYSEQGLGIYIINNSTPISIVNSFIYSNYEYDILVSQFIDKIEFINMKQLARKSKPSSLPSELFVPPESTIYLEAKPCDSNGLLNNTPGGGAELHGAGLKCNSQDDDANDVGATQTSQSYSDITVSRSRRQLGL